MAVNHNDKTIELVGHIDAYDPEKGIIYDFKTTSFLTWQLEKRKLPHEHHVRQIQAYDVLLSDYGFPVNRLELWYMDDRTPPLRIVVRREDIKKWLVSRLETLHESVTKTREPRIEASYVCRMCSFIEVCRPDICNRHLIWRHGSEVR